ncbi:hypothetical protein HMPREF1544_05639 [Mucor circinelloides 1006PhL]|uniref:Uncharacterized protein n=1 Tax=Mucor circinelloides f. circinelloides (strain 1006PhL) TaxID=1220926 RepID=S2JXN9_MUCC1|nr:hypothetical protein HMPREF1544_05639 [Mucor circinelloides 1006PhL]
MCGSRNCMVGTLPTLIANQYNFSQTCLFCFHKLSDPMLAVHDKIKTINGSFVCLNAPLPPTHLSLFAEIKSLPWQSASLALLAFCLV